MSLFPFLPTYHTVQLRNRTAPFMLDTVPLPIVPLSSSPSPSHACGTGDRSGMRYSVGLGDVSCAMDICVSANFAALFLSQSIFVLSFCLSLFSLLLLTPSFPSPTSFPRLHVDPTMLFSASLIVRSAFGDPDRWSLGPLVHDMVMRGFVSSDSGYTYMHRAVALRPLFRFLDTSCSIASVTPLPLPSSRSTSSIQ